MQKEGNRISLQKSETGIMVSFYLQEKRDVVWTQDLGKMLLFLFQQQSAATTSYSRWSAEAAELEEYVMPSYT